MTYGVGGAHDVFGALHRPDAQLRSAVDSRWPTISLNTNGEHPVRSVDSRTSASTRRSNSSMVSSSLFSARMNSPLPLPALTRPLRPISPNHDRESGSEQATRGSSPLI